MRTIYKWEIKVVVWEDGRALRRKFNMVAKDVEHLMHLLRNMDDVFCNCSVESVENKGRWLK